MRDGDKADAIWPYKYHIVLENDHSEHFMTEKLTDAFLGWSYPIYFGSSEAYHRFPEGSFTAIDIYQPEQSLAIIRELLDMPTYEAALPAIADARESVLGKNNLFAMLASYWREISFAIRSNDQAIAQVASCEFSNPTTQPHAPPSCVDFYRARVTSFTFRVRICRFGNRHSYCKWNRG